jgi:carbon starvation protein CstA
MTFGAMALVHLRLRHPGWPPASAATSCKSSTGTPPAWLHTRGGALLATAATCGVPLAFVFLATQSGSYRLFWTLFGTSNQLLAALSLLAITVWMKRQGRRTWYTFYPMLGVMAVTVTSLGLQARQLWQAHAGSPPWINGLVSVLLLALAAVMVLDALRPRPLGELPTTGEVGAG